jgi:PPOX class probable F420-dependent enzyme
VARKDITMSEDETKRFLEAGRVVQVASLGHDGWPHLVPMWYVVEDGRIVFRSFTKSQKIVNLTRDPRLTVLVESGDAYAELRGVLIKGTARLDDEPERVLALYGAMAAKYAMVDDRPVHLDPEALEAAFGRFAAKNTAVTVVPDRVITWDHTKLGGAY